MNPNALIPWVVDTMPTESFELGEIENTPTYESLPREEKVVMVGRHIAGEPGDIERANWRPHESRLERDGSVVSVFNSESTGDRILVCTTPDRSVTAVHRSNDLY